MLVREIKILKIYNCMTCPRYYEASDGFHCDISNIKFDEGEDYYDKIHKDCPLDSYYDAI